MTERPQPVFIPARRPIARRTQRSVLVMGVGLSFFLLFLTVFRPSAMIQLDNLGYDELLSSLRRIPPPSEVVIVDVDEKSLRELGQWPWPRYQIARLLETLHEADVKSVGIDFILAEPDRLSLNQLKESLQQALQVSIDFSQVPTDYLDNDALLARTMAFPEVVASIWFMFDEPDRAVIPSLPIPEIVIQRSADAPESIPLPKASSALYPLSQLSHSVQSIGFLNALPDSDGKIRRAPLLIACQDRIYPSLALAAVMRKIGVFQATMRVSAAGIEEVQVGDIRIPTDRQGGMLLPFNQAGRQQFQWVSAVDLLKKNVLLDQLRGKVVFLGSSAAGQQDVQATPLDRRFPGVQVHAVTADAILRGSFLHSPAWSIGVQCILVLVLGAIMTVLLSRYSLTVCALTGAGGLTGLWYGAQWLLNAHGLYLSPVTPMAALGATFIILGVVRFRREENVARQKSYELALAQDCAILGLVTVAETRDPETGGHIVRTQYYVRALAMQLAKKPQYKKELSAETLDMLFKSAPLHDIGKVGIPDNILLKPGRLTDEEFDVMRLHTIAGHQALVRAERISGIKQKLSFLRYAQEIALAHHERWDGKGYPKGLKGAEIPLAARLMALADVYDALRSKRPYKPPLPHAEAAKLISAGSGTQFDPDVVQAFNEIEDIFIAIAGRDPDKEKVLP